MFKVARGWIQQRGELGEITILLKITSMSQNRTNAKRICMVSAIGLQEVVGLKTSECLLRTVVRNCILELVDNLNLAY